MQEFVSDIYYTIPERNRDRKLEISRCMETYDANDYIVIDDTRSLY